MKTKKKKHKNSKKNDLFFLSPSLSLFFVGDKIDSLVAAISSSPLSAYVCR